MIKKIFILPIKFYQYFISPLLGQNCRFHPTCSNYTIEAFEKLPWWKAIFKSIYRILRCHPFSKGGVDPVIKNDS